MTTTDTVIPTCALCTQRVAEYHTLLPRQVGDLTLDPRAGAIRCGDQRVDLTRTEYQLVLQLAARQGAVVRPEELAEAFRSEPICRADLSDRLKVNLTRVRRKLADAGSHALVANVRSAGYMLVANP